MQEDNEIKVTQINDLIPMAVGTWTADRFLDAALPWTYWDRADSKDTRLHNHFQMQHIVYNHDIALSPIYDICMNILLTAMEKSGRKLDNWFKITIINSMPGDVAKSLPHIDIVGPHQTGLYFPFGSSGTTDIYKQRSFLQSWDLPETYDLARQLAPEFNTWYDFDGSHWRVDGRPVEHESRICVVYNFISSPTE